MTLDWIQIYFFVSLIIGITIECILHGKDKGEHNIFIYLIALLLYSPIIGRMFNWW